MKHYQKHDYKSRYELFHEEVKKQRFKTEDNHAAMLYFRAVNLGLHVECEDLVMDRRLTTKRVQRMTELESKIEKLEQIKRGYLEQNESISEYLQNIRARA